MAATSPVPSRTPRGSTHRTVGLAMLGSAVALAACAALTAAGVLSMPEEARSWAAGGMGLAAALDAALAFHFLRVSSQS